MAGLGHGQWRLQRRFDQQQHRRSGCLRWLDNGDLHLHQHLRTPDHHLPSYFHSGSTLNSGAYLSCEHDSGFLPDTGCGEHGLCHMAGQCNGERRLQRCPDQQQYGSACCLWWFYHCYFYLYKFLRTIDDDVPGDLHGCGSASSGFDMSNPDDRKRLFDPIAA